MTIVHSLLCDSCCEEGGGLEEGIGERLVHLDSCCVRRVGVGRGLSTRIVAV